MEELANFFRMIRQEVLERDLEPGDFNALDCEQAISDWGYYFVCGKSPIEALRREYPNTEW